MWGAFLGLIAQGLYLNYTFLLVKRPQPPPDPKTARRQRALHYGVMGLSYVLIVYLLIRICCGTLRPHAVLESGPPPCDHHHHSPPTHAFNRVQRGPTTCVRDSRRAATRTRSAPYPPPARGWPTSRHQGRTPTASRPRASMCVPCGPERNDWPLTDEMLCLYNFAIF